MTRDDVSVNAKTSATVRPSRVIQALAAVTTLYLAIAVYHGAIGGLKLIDASMAIGFGATLLLIGLASQVQWRFGAILALGLSFVAQIAWVGWIGPDPIGDDGDLRVLAITVAGKLRTGDLALQEFYSSSSPSTLFLYSAAIAIVGDETFLPVVTAALWTAQAWLVWRICEEVAELRGRGVVAAILFGLSPAVIVFGGQPSLEATFGFFALTAVYLVLSHRRRGLGMSALLSGFFGALAFLAHPAGMAYVAGLVVVLLVGLSWEKRWPGRWRMALAVVACMIGFGVGVAPQVTLNNAVDGRPSIAPGLAIAENLFYGTDYAYGGDVGNSGVAERIGLTPGSDVPLRIADMRARDIAYGVISDDPQTFFLFAITTKMSTIWGSERDLLEPSRNAPGRSPAEFDATIVGSVAPSLIDGVYLATLLLAFGGALRLTIRSGAVRDPTRWVLILVAVLCLAASNLFLRAHPRAHLAFTPLLVLMAPIAVAPLPRVLSIRGEMRERQAAVAEREKQTEEAFDLANIHKPKPVDPEVARKSPEERLANVLKGMSKPPRPDEDDGPPPLASPRGRDASA